jgi:hypothetical protein
MGVCVVILSESSAAARIGADRVSEIAKIPASAKRFQFVFFFMQSFFLFKVFMFMDGGKHRIARGHTPPSNCSAAQNVALHKYASNVRWG